MSHILAVAHIPSYWDIHEVVIKSTYIDKHISTWSVFLSADFPMASSAAPSNLFLGAEDKLSHQIPVDYHGYYVFGSPSLTRCTISYGLLRQ